MHFILIKTVLSNNLSYVTIFHCSLRRSHKTSYASKFAPKRNVTGKNNRINTTRQCVKLDRATILIKSPLRDTFL